MKKFFEDLWDIEVRTFAFLAQHWKGYLILTCIVTGITYGGLTVWSRWDEIKEKLFKKN